MMTNIPVNKIVSTEKNKLSKLEGIIKDKIIGQDEAVSKLSNLFKETEQV